MADFELAMHTYACCLYNSPPKSGSTNDYSVHTVHTLRILYGSSFTPTIETIRSDLLRLLLSSDSLYIQNVTEKTHDDSQPLFIA